MNIRREIDKSEKVKIYTAVPNITYKTKRVQCILEFTEIHDTRITIGRVYDNK